MKKIFICSPLRGNYKENIKRARKHSRDVAMKGYLPITPHIYFTQFLNDRKKKERELGIKLGLELLKICDEIWVYGKPTEGMKREINLAKKLKIKIRAVDNSY